MGLKKPNSEKLRATISGMLDNPEVGLSQNQMAKQIGISAASLGNWRKGRKGSYAEIEAKIERWIGSYNAGENFASALPPEPEWVETPTAQRIFQTLETAQFIRGLTMAYGAAGAGKTKTCEQYVATQPNVWMVTPTKLTATARAVMLLLCDSLGITDHGAGGLGIKKSILGKVRGTAGLIIVDEGQQLTIGALDELRQVQEQAGIGLCLVGNEPLYTQMTGGHRQPQFAQLFSRIAMRTHIEGTSGDDVATMCAALGITDKDAVQYLTRIGTLPGGLRGVAKTVQLAQLAAAGSTGKLNKNLIARAWRKLTGTGGAE